MPAAVPIVATIAAGVAAANEMYAIAMVITVAAQIATQMMTKTPGLNSYRDTAERKQVLRAAAAQKRLFMVERRQPAHCSFLRSRKANRTMAKCCTWPLRWRDIHYPASELSGWVMSLSVVILNTHRLSCTPTDRRRTRSCWRTARHGKMT